MADDPKKRGQPDRIRINVGQDYERRYWSKALCTSQADLKWIVKKVGPMVQNVKNFMIQRITKAGGEL